MRKIFLVSFLMFITNPVLGREDVVIAVIDSGLDISHTELKDSLWKNPKEIPGNNVDDDQNGFVDDVHGWDFVENRPIGIDPNGHGTHIAGIIAAKGINSKLGRGLGYGSKIMAVRYYSDRKGGEENLVASINAFQYAIDNGAHIINYSGGGPKPDRREKNVIHQTYLKNILVVAAAGNFGKNLEGNGFYPASYSYRNIISVAAIDKKGELIRPSNYGSSQVDISSIGKQVFSTLPANQYGRMSGTSQATAKVTAIAGKIMLREPHLKNSPQELANRLAFAGLKLPSLKRKIATEAYLEPNRTFRIRSKSVDAFGDTLSSQPVLDALLHPKGDEIDALSKYLLQ